MPTVDDLFSQLKDLNQNLQALSVAITSGFQNEAALQAYANDALFQLSQQSDKTICILENISRNSCQLLNEAHTQTASQKSLIRMISHLILVEETAHPDGALQAVRMEDIERRLTECCPSEQPKAPCLYEPCDKVGPLKPPTADPPIR